MNAGRIYPVDRIVASLKQEEGYRPHVYRDHLGYATIGIGRCVEPGRGLGISEDEAEYLLKGDVFRSIRELEANFPQFATIDADHQAVLIELCFQLGLPTLRKFQKMLAAIWEQRWHAAAEELLDSRYAEQVPARARRYADRLLGAD